MNNRHAASSAQNRDAIPGKTRGQDEAAPREQRQHLVEFTAGLTQQVSELVERARHHAMLESERRVLAVVHRLVDEREEAAVTEAQARRLISELQNQLEQARADNRALKSQLGVIRAISGASTVISTGVVEFAPVTASFLSPPASHEIMHGSLVRYRLDCPWRVDMTGRPYVMALTDREWPSVPQSSVAQTG